MKLVDLHVHSNCSDGTFTPTELVDYAIQKKLSAFALTDHDTTDGLNEAITYAKVLRQQRLPAPEVIPGIELSTEYQGKDIHIVGLYLDYQRDFFQEQLKAFVASRDQRNQKMCALLREAGIEISYEQLEQEFPNAVITRAHYGKFLFSHGYVNSIAEAFERYVGDHCPYFVPREKVTPAQAIQLILAADGIPILAHPILYHMSDSRLNNLVAELKEKGLLGIEAIYSTYHTAEERQIRKLAQDYHLLISGGSDFHGATKPGLDLGCGYGKLVVPMSVLADLKKSRAKLLFTDMDGTLLNKDSTLSPTIKCLLDRMTSQGHHLILTSGRPLESILEVCRKEAITYPHMLIISNNGAQIYDCDSGHNLLVHRLSPEDIRFIVTEAERMHIHIHGYTDKEIVCHERNEELQYYTRRIHLPLQCVEDIPSALPDGSYKLQAIELKDRSRLEAFRDSVAPYCAERVQFIFSNDQYLEILPVSAGKGKALDFVREYLHTPLSHTYAAGDAENDISMLQAAGTGIAMLNASEQVKAAAHIVTSKDNNHNGLAEILINFFCGEDSNSVE